MAPVARQLLRTLAFLSLLLASASSGCSGEPGDDPDAGSCEEIDLPTVCPGRGFYADPVSVVLAGTDDDDVVYYSLDGSEPGPLSGSPAIYEGEPLLIDPPASRGGATTLRVVAYHDDNSRTTIVTHTYLFPERILEQPALPDGVPSEWGFDTNTRPGDYEMDARAFADGDERAEAIDALRAIPTLSLTTDPENLWTPVSGLYMRPDAVGSDFERPVSVELLVPDSNAEAGFVTYRTDAGIQIQGNSSTRGWKSAKLSLRLAFRSQYGDDAFRAPLFADSTVERFENLVLDAHLNYTWIHPEAAQRDRSQYARDQYMARLQNEIGSLAPHSAPMHVYLNGLYWGLYDVHERPDEHFMSSYLGGAPDDWDVIRHDETGLVSGDLDAWNQMFALARAGLDDNGNYASFSALLDVDRFIDYMLINFYAGNQDWDHHNWYAARDRVAGGGFRFFSWDAERVLVDTNEDVTTTLNSGAPTELFAELRARADFRADFTARATELYAAGGALEAGAAAALYTDVTEPLRTNILLESARWGDNQVSVPYTRADWDAERQLLLESYFPARSAIAEGQLPAP